MMAVGFIPGLDIIIDAYQVLRAVIDVASGKGSWADVAMAAVFLLLPVAVGRVQGDEEGDERPRRGGGRGQDGEHPRDK